MTSDKQLCKVLSRNEVVSLLELIHESCSCKSEGDFRDLMDSLKELIPFEFAICGMVRTGEDRSVKSYDVINISYPAEWLSVYIAKGYHAIDPIMKENLAGFGLQYWSDTYSAYDTPREFIFSACDFGLREGYTYGVKKLRGNEGSVFSIAGNSIKREDRTEAILRLIIPHFHNALDRVVDCHLPRQKFVIRGREQEVLKWLRLGKTNSEIGDILNISENTVKYHLKTLMKKLNSRTRTQCIAVAMENRLIDIE